MEFFRILKSKKFLINLGIIVVLSVIILFVVLKGLNVFTLHGQSTEVPDYTGLYLEELKDNDLNKDFEFVVIDSIYDFQKEKGTIIQQDPFACSRVKKGRKIYLTVVAMLPEQVAMPNLVDLTLRHAKAILEIHGLEVASLEYVPDIAKNAVLKQKYKGENIEGGTKIEKGSKIDLVLGEGLIKERIIVPLLIGKTRNEALRILHSYSLNLGSEIFEDGNDTSFARVYKQQPRASKMKIIKLGQSVNLWYRSEKNFDFKKYIKKYERDSIIQDENEDI